MVYTNEDLKLAKEYLVKRLRAEQSSSRNLEDKLLEVAKEIITLCQIYKVSPKDIKTTRNLRFQRALERVMNKLEEDLYDMIEDLCVYANEEDKKHIIAFINMNIAGMTLSSRLKKHIETFKKQMLDSISKDGGFENKGEMKSIIKFGAGHSLDVLLRNTVGRTYNEEWKNMHPNATWFYSRRGSSYPCPACDEAVGWHPIADYPSYGGWHPNCCCIFTFSTNPINL